jgi:hypothetical protein
MTSRRNLVTSESVCGHSTANSHRSHSAQPATPLAIATFPTFGASFQNPSAAKKVVEIGRAICYVHPYTIQQSPDEVVL